MLILSHVGVYTEEVALVDLFQPHRIGIYC